ncbi:transglycosylase domain-containing protein [Geodermatophilus sp. DSM 44513]|uniref:transglycosylase domain-containing protein n=1 Tax=Geodermatophilus sp. DSM 44513 TaxID=1528104 RepID=UPI0028F73360|nr:transglycosylase domain-containing protein [Geodermatophilus sp. DSM 44513]WNV76648.1 transglycosylase domain-containing protein [Geodermatophilus sp. DSM 44513]
MALRQLVPAVVVAGVLVACFVLPWVGGAGLLARASVPPAGALPAELTAAPPGNTRVLAADGSLITTFHTDDRVPVTSDQVADVVEEAVVAVEDERFFEHNGLDVQGTLRALLTNLAAGSVEQGGSSLTQQLVKQSLLQGAETTGQRTAATERSVDRKLREARLALALERTVSKQEILTRYLNTVYFGNGAYGIQAAARRWFSVDAADLTLPQAALLAGMVQNPAAHDPVARPAAALARRDVVLGRMHRTGAIDAAELASARSRPLDTRPGPGSPRGCAGAVVGGFFCAYLEQYLARELGIDRARLDRGGLTVRTTLRADVQLAGDVAVRRTVPEGDPLAGVYTAVQPGTGHVLAMSVNRRYGCPDAGCESVLLPTARSQGAGSTYKVFTAAAALERGIPASHVITADDPYVSRVYLDDGAPYTVRAYAAADIRTMTMEQALYRSSNPYFMALQDQLGSVEGPVRVAERMGLHFTETSADALVAQDRGSFTLGAEPTSPLDLATAFATLAAGGTRCEPTPVVAVLDRDGRPLTGPGGRPLPTGSMCTPAAVAPAVADTLAQVLRTVVEPGADPMQSGAAAYVPGHQIAGKTGTSQGGFSVAFAGFTPAYSASVMVFDPKRNQEVPGGGGDKGATIWHDAMAPVLTGEPVVPFPPADPVLSGQVPPPDRAADRASRAGGD